MVKFDCFAYIYYIHEPASTVLTTYRERRHHYSCCGLNGIAYTGDHLLTVQTITGRLFKVDAEVRTVMVVRLERPLVGEEAVAVRRDGAAVVMAQETAWLLRSGEGGAAPWWKGRWSWTRGGFRPGWW